MNKNLVSAEELKSWRFRLKALYPLIYTIFFLISPILFSLLKLNYLAIAFLIFLAVNWAFRSLQTLYGLITGYILYKKSKKINWSNKLQNLIEKWEELPDRNELPISWHKFRLAIIIPVYKESYSVLYSTIKSIKDSNFDLQKIDIIIASEERAGIETQNNIKKLKNVFKDLNIYNFIHPQNIPGEVIGIAGPNLRWASIQYYKLIKKQGVDPKNILMLKYDSDTRLHPDFLANLTCRYLLDSNRYQKFYTPAIILYSNNIWRVPVFSRVFWILFSFVILSSWQTLKHRAMSFSIYAFNFKTLINIGFWDPVIGIDDTEFFIQAFIHFKTEFQGQMIYTPVFMDAVEGTSFIQTAKNLFKQQIRWGAGAILAPITLYNLWKMKGPRLLTRIKWTLYFIESYSLIPTASYLLSLGMPIILIINNYLTYLIAGHMIPLLLATMMKVTVLFSLIILYIILKIYRDASHDKSGFIGRFFITFIEFYLVAINSIIFSLIPYTLAQIRIVLGKYGKFHVVEKIR